MIKLTRLNGQEFVLNSDLIKSVDARPDTYITLISNDHIIVREAMEDVVKRTLEYRRLSHPLCKSRI